MTLSIKDYAMLNAGTPEAEPVRVTKVHDDERTVIRLKPGIYTAAEMFVEIDASDLRPITRDRMLKWFNEERVI